MREIRIKKVPKCLRARRSARCGEWFRTPGYIFFEITLSLCVEQEALPLQRTSCLRSS